MHIETPRLILRGWTDADLNAYADMVGDPQVMEYYVSTVPRETALQHAREIRDRLQKNGYGRYVMEIKGRPGFAGMMVLDDIRYDVPFEPKVEIGWMLPVHAWGKGYATEAARELLRVAFEELQWPEVIAMTSAINERSQSVMRKLGMTRDPAEDFDHPHLPKGHVLQRCVLYRARPSTGSG